MEALQKKLLSAAAIGGVLVLAAVGVTKSGVTDILGKGGEPSADTEAAEEAYRSAAADVIFWYEDESYTKFFEEAARTYFDRTGVKVAVQCQNVPDHIDAIYDETMRDGAFPDVYLISGDNLEEAYRYGLVSVNENDVSAARAAKNAVAASTYQGKVLGYPLSFNTCVFVYQNGYFETAPDSLQALIDYSDANEPPENVSYLLEWDVNDAFYDFPFISNSVTFEKTEAEKLNVIYNEELYQQDLAYFEKILESFSVDAQNVSEESIIENFLGGRTLSAMIDTSSLYQLDGYEYSLMQIPDLSDTLPADPCAVTDMLVVNDFSEKGEEAAAFAWFATVAMAGELHELSGHYSVIPSEEPDWVEQVAFDAYESAVLAPDSVDAKDFWVSLEETISKYF